MRSENFQIINLIGNKNNTQINTVFENAGNLGTTIGREIFEIFYNINSETPSGFLSGNTTPIALPLTGHVITNCDTEYPLLWYKLLKNSQYSNHLILSSTISRNISSEKFLNLL